MVAGGDDLLWVKLKGHVQRLNEHLDEADLRQLMHGEYFRNNGALFGIPEYYNFPMLYYRKDLLEDPAEQKAFPANSAGLSSPPATSTSWSKWRNSSIDLPKCTASSSEAWNGRSFSTTPTSLSAIKRTSGIWTRRVVAQYPSGTACHECPLHHGAVRSSRLAESELPRRRASLSFRKSFYVSKLDVCNQNADGEDARESRPGACGRRPTTGRTSGSFCRCHAQIRPDPRYGPARSFRGC